MPHPPRTVVLLAAGSSRRLGELTRSRPKCLLEVGGLSLLEHQIRSFRAVGVREFVVVTGFCAGQIHECLGAGARVVHNEVFDRTNSLYSLNLALPTCTGPLFVANADVLFHPRLLHRLATAPHPDALLYEPAAELGDEEMKVRIAAGRIAALGKTLPAGTYHGENLGLLKFSAAGAAQLAAAARELIEGGDVNAWAPRAIDRICGDLAIHAVASDPLPWIEIDFPEDLERARTVVWPRIARERAADRGAELGELSEPGRGRG